MNEVRKVRREMMDSRSRVLRGGTVREDHRDHRALQGLQCLLWIVEVCRGCRALPDREDTKAKQG